METEFEVTIPHLVRLCDDILTGALSPRDLEAIGFCLMASDKFYWTEQPPISEYISDTLHDWTAPEINYQLTQSTVAKFKHRLLTGENPFGPGDYFSDGPHTARPDEPEPKL